LLTKVKLLGLLMIGIREGTPYLRATWSVGVMEQVVNTKTHGDCWGYTPSCFAIPQEQFPAVLVIL